METAHSPGKRQLIVESAAEVFARSGYATTRVADIAAAAGIGKGTVYEYFSSKEELFFAVFEWIDEQIRRRVDGPLAVPGTACEQLRAILAESAAIVAENRDLVSINLDFWSASRGSASEHRFTDACRSVYHDYREILSRVIRRGQQEGDFRSDLEPEGVATLIVSALDGLGVQHWLDGSIDPRAAVQAFADALCAGLCRTQE